MPQDDFFSTSSFLVEYRGIRTGEMGGRSPVKVPPRVRMPMRNPATKKFDIDERVMRAASERHGADPGDWATSVKAIPVMLTSDKIVGDGDSVIYIERAFYTGSGRQCGSPLGSASAAQRVDVAAYAKNKSLKVYDQPKSVDCNDKCPLWPKRGEKSDCSWRAIVNMQLLDSPTFPSRTSHRTKSFYSIMSMIGSLNAISRETGGVLAGIPLMFRQYIIDVRAAAGGEQRRIPIMSFDFDGSVAELRRLAISELQSRENMNRATRGEFVGLIHEPVKKEAVSMPMILGSESEDEVVIESVDEEEEEVLGPSPATDEDMTRARELESEIAKTAKALGYTPARMRLLENKHAGDLQAMLADLRIESGASQQAPSSTKAAAPTPVSGDKWGPGEAGDDYLGADDLDF